LNRKGINPSFLNSFLLLQKDISYSEALKKPKSELASLLGVGAVISTNTFMKKPMREGVAVVDFILGGPMVNNTNTVSTNIYIHEAKEGKLIWDYEYEVSGNLGSSPEKLVDILMRNASKRFPYTAQ
jgi:hypothetical protein